MSAGKVIELKFNGVNTKEDILDAIKKQLDKEFPTSINGGKVDQDTAILVVNYVAL